MRSILLAAVLAVLVVAPASGAQTATRVSAPAATLKRATCPSDLRGCRSAIGRVVLVESVDPDGDGDLHVVVTDPNGVTLRGLTSVDVSKDLRPRRDPRVGDRAAAMGPVQTGSFGQSQIHALEFRVRRR